MSDDRIPDERPDTPRVNVAMSPTRQGATLFLRPKSDQLFFVFTGFRRGVGVDPVIFFSQTGLLSRNVVIFQDRHRAFYQRGISSTLDSFDALLQWQVQFRDSLPHVRRVFCLGASAGGYAALLAGHCIGAERVWAFGPNTTLPEEIHATMPISPERRDLALSLGTGGSRTAHGIYYNESCTVDQIAARHVSKCPGVELHPQHGTGHAVVSTMSQAGSLTTLLVPPT